MPTIEDLLYLSGDLFLPKPVRDVLETYHYGSDTSLVYITNWSLIHIVSGVLVGYILIWHYPNYSYYLTGFWIHTAWEIWQILVKNTPYWTLRGRVDVVVDTILYMLGMAFIAQISQNRFLLIYR
jgi:hypothetical protein